MEKEAKNRNGEKRKNIPLIILIAVFAVIIVSALCFFSCKLSKPSPAPIIPTPNPAFTAEPSAAAHTAAAEPSPAVTASPSPVPVANEMPEPRGMVFAGDKLSFGLSTCGLVSYIGSSEGQAYCYDWKDILQIAGGGGFTVGLDKNGKIFISANPEIFDFDFSEWENIVSVAASDNAVYGLKSDGTVCSTDNSCAGLNRIVKIAAGKDFLTALSFEGKLFTVGNAPDISAWENEEMTSAAAGNSHILALTKDGRLLTTESAAPFTGITDISEIFACGNDSAIITTDGKLYTNCEFIDSPIENAVDFSSNFGHALVLLDNGRTLAYGDNEYLQCRVENWRLRPYSEENGFILGIKPESGIKTGDSYTLANGESGAAVILGDVNCDGRINSDDKKMIADFIGGKIELSDVQKRAANIIADSKQPDAVDVFDLEQLDCALKGFITIDQYAKPFRYSGETADAERLNSDTVGYIDLENTNIRHPLMYGENFYYHTHNPAKASGWRKTSAYLYYPDLNKNIVITGHNYHSYPGIMLHQLQKIQDEYAKDYSVFTKRLWEINIFGETHFWEVFAMYEEKPIAKEYSSLYYNANYPYSMNNMDDKAITKWINYQFDRTELDYKPYVTSADQFMTILTCSDTHAESNRGGRIYFFLRRVDGH